MHPPLVFLYLLKVVPLKTCSQQRVEFITKLVLA